MPLARNTRQALVVGAGIGGLAAALALRRRGWSVRVFERAASPRELGFALLLAPNAMHALDQLGLADRVRQEGAVAESGEIRRTDGTVLRLFDAGAVSARLGETPVCVLRPALHGALLEAVGLDTITLDSQVTSFTPVDGGVEVTIADGRRAAGEILIGADGVSSAIRRQLHPAEPPPSPSGFIAMRGVAHDVVPQLGGSTGAQYLGRGLEAGLARASDRAVYRYLSLLEDEVDRAGGTSDPQALLDWFVRTPRSGPGPTPRGAFHAPFRAIVDATAPEDLRVDRLLVRDHLTTWGSGPVTLLGDAAHPMLPHAGQGAAQALEDAVALGERLASAATAPDGLRAYERRRMPRTRAVVDLARRNARVGSVRGAFTRPLRDLAIRLVPVSIIMKALLAAGRPPAE